MSENYWMCLFFKGHLVQLRADGSNHVVTDQDWLGEVITCILSFPRQKIGENITYVHPDTEVVYLPDLHAKLTDMFRSKEEVSCCLILLRRILFV